MGAGASTTNPPFETVEAALAAGKTQEEVDAWQAENAVITGTCFCGAVKVTAVGQPKVQAICHCNSCRHWTGSCMFVNLYPADKVTIEGEVDSFKLKEDSISLRKTCKTCKGPVVNDHAEAMKMMDIPGGVLNVPFTPAMHLHYAEKILSFKDGLPKFKDLPEAFHGSNEMLED